MTAFARAVPSEIAALTIDPSTPIPYANLTVPSGRRRFHGLAGFRT